MNENTGVIIIIIGIAIIIFLLIILLLIKVGVLGENKQTYAVKKVYVKDGKDIDYMSGGTREMGLNGFWEDKSETLVVGVTGKYRYLTIEFENTATGKVFSGTLAKMLIVGRKNVNNTSGYLEVTDDNTISKNHAEISLYGSEVFIRDLGSTNHTWVNGYYITELTRVNSGDIVRLGNSDYKINIR